MKRYVVLILLVVLAIAPCKGQNEGGTTMDAGRPKIGLALSGGGAKGAAHIGVLKYIEEIGIPIDYVAGTSIGAIVGGLYSLGYTSDELAEFIANMDWSYYMSNSVVRSFQSSSGREQQSQHLVSVPFGVTSNIGQTYDILSTLPSGVINGASLVNLFTSLSIGYNDSVDFGRLPIPFACVATDIVSGDSVVLRKGNLAKAIRASMAIPGIFSPVHWDSRLLVDGGMTNNFPVDVCREMGADIVIGVDLADRMASSPEELKSLPQQVSQYLNLLVSNNIGDNKELCDLYMHPDISGYGTLSFTQYAIDTLIRRGYECAKAHHDAFVLLKHRIEGKGACRQTYQAPRAQYITGKDTFVLAEVVYNGVTESERAWLNSQSGLEVGMPMTAADIDKAVKILTGTGGFSAITYTLYETEEAYWLTHAVYSDALGLESYRLVINLERAEPHKFAIGLRYDSEESASMLLHLGWNEQRMAGYKVALNANLNYNLRWDMGISYCAIGLGEVNLKYRYHNSSVNVSRSDSLAFSGYVDHHNVSLFLSEFNLREFTVAVGFDEDFYADRSGFSINDISGSGIFHLDRTKNFFGTFLRGRYDNLDDAYFATQGFYGKFDFSWRKENKYLFNAEVDSGFATAMASFKTYFSPHPRVTFVPQGAVRLVMGKNSPWYDNFIGGALAGRYLDHQMAFIGLTNPMYVENYAAVFRLDTRYNIHGNFYSYLMLNYLVNMPEFEFLGQDLKGVLGIGLRAAYKSFIGPIMLDLYWNSLTHKVGAYLNIGYVF